MKKFFLLVFSICLHLSIIAQSGQALDFDGNDDYVDCGSSINLANQSFAVEFWAKRNGPVSSGAEEFVFSSGTPGNSNKLIHIGFVEWNGAQYFRFAFWGDDLLEQYTDDFAWHHWACTYDAGTKKQLVYKDGALLFSRTATIGFSGTGTTIIGNRQGNWTTLNGQLDEVRVWNDVRTVTEINDNMCIGLSGSEANLVAYYSFDNMTTANGTANEVQDESTNNNNGTSSGMDNSDIVDLNLAGDFDGIDDDIDCGSSINLVNQSFTIDFWAKRGGLNSEDYVVWQEGVGAAYQQLAVGWRSNNKFLFSFWGDDLDISGFTGLDWHHWACTYNATTNERKVYRDGVVVGSDSPASDYIGTGDLWISPPSSISHPFYGQIDEVRVWNLALTASDVTALKDDTFSDPTTISSCLMAYYKLNESCGTTTLDATGNGHNGTLQNGVGKTSSGAVVSLQAPPACAVLPVELISFNAEKAENGASLSWKTATEINNDYFDVQWSTDGVDFKSIGQVQGAGTITEIQSYEFLHENPVNGNNYYRLKQVDFDEKFEYSNIVLLNYQSSTANPALQIYPNPAMDYLVIKTTNDLTTDIIQIFNVFGQEVKTFRMKESNNQYSIADLAAGTYFVKVGTEVQRIIVSK